MLDSDIFAWFICGQRVKNPKVILVKKRLLNYLPFILD